MNLTTAINRNSVLVFGIFLLAAFYAFWPGYFHNPFSVSDYHVHIHGIIASLWCILLITQALLIRKNNRELHRKLGKLSYGLAPLVFLSTLSAYQNSVQGNTVEVPDLLFSALVFGEVTCFALMYGLAIYNRDKPAIHARYMICTPLPMIPPVFNRIIFYTIPDSLHVLPTIDGYEIPLGYTVPATYLIIVGLLVWDWKSHKRLNVFPVVLVIFVIFEGLSLFLYRVPLWGTFIEWFFALQLP